MRRASTAINDYIQRNEYLLIQINIDKLTIAYIILHIYNIHICTYTSDIKKCEELSGQKKKERKENK